MDTLLVRLVLIPFIAAVLAAFLAALLAEWLGGVVRGFLPEKSS